MDYKISIEKIEKLKNRHIYFNHHSELRNYTQMDFTQIPQEYHYFISQDKSIEALYYYNSFYFRMLHKAENEVINQILEDTIYSLEGVSLTQLKKVIEKKNTYQLLLKKAHSTYQIDFDRRIGNKISQSMLHIYSSAYENTEYLYTLYWIAQALKGQILTSNFDKYKDRAGRISKGLLIKDIVRMYNKFPDFQSVIKDAYHKNLRHLCFHNNAEIDDEKRRIIEIDNPTNYESFEMMYNSFYSIQQLHNYLRLFVSTLLIDKEPLTNEGLLLVATLYFNERQNELFLFQLWPFYDLDKKTQKKIKEVIIKEDGNDYIFMVNERELVRTQKDSLIDQWYVRENRTLYVAPIKPHIYEDEEDLFVLHSGFGEFVFEEEYEVSNIFNYSGDSH